MKARKNKAELDGAAQGAAARWRCDRALPPLVRCRGAERQTQRDRCGAGARNLSAQIGKLKDVSFPTISAAGPNSAIPHYRVTTSTNRKIDKGIFLIDSGGQYEDGTTDITRTLAVGTPSAEMRDRFTRVLEGQYRDQPRGLSRKGRQARRSMPSPAMRSGRPASISIMARAMASAPISPCMKGRSASPRSARRRSNPA